MSDAKRNLDALLGNKKKPVEKKVYNPKYENDKSTVIGIRMRKDDLEILKKHFKRQGIINTSQGIRSIIYAFMIDMKLID